MKAWIIVLALLVPAAAYGQTAEEHHRRGQAAYDRGDFAEATEQWTQAVELTGDAAVKAGLLFNLGQAQRHVGDCPAALASYQEALRLAPDAPEAATAEQFVRELRVQCGPPPRKPQKAVPPPIIAVPPSDRRPGRTKKIVGLATMGGGALFVATGLYYGNRARALAADVSTACSVACNWPDVEPIDTEGRRAETRQWIFLGLGAATVATGGVLYYLGVHDRAPGVALTPTGGDGVGITWSGVW